MSETEIQPTQNIKNNPKIMKAWAVYDWANSVYSLVITSAIFPIYYTILTTAYNKKEYVPEAKEIQEIPVRNMIKVFGEAYEPEAVLSFSYAISFFLVVLLSPFLSSLADTIGNKKIISSVFLLFGCDFLYGISHVYRYGKYLLRAPFQYYCECWFLGKFSIL
jgi:UMF1 family MFS transporter